jgi:hypothetical protein
MRDTAVGGLAALLNRPEWRDSGARPSIASEVSAAMRDTNPVVRMRAARAAYALYASVGPAERAEAIGELLLAEEDPIVRAVLIDQLTAAATDAPVTIDAVLQLIFEARDDALANPGRDPGRTVLTLLTYLALVPQTPFASGIIETWCANAPANAAVVEAFAQTARNYLAPPGGPGQLAAFRMLGTAADAAFARWTRNPDEHLAGVDLSVTQLAELRGAVEVAHGIAQEIYFASGAFDEKQGNERSNPDGLAGFADLAFPVLATCAGLHVAQCARPRLHLRRRVPVARNQLVARTRQTGSPMEEDLSSPREREWPPGDPVRRGSTHHEPIIRHRDNIVRGERVERVDVLGGLIHEYHRAA